MANLNVTNPDGMTFDHWSDIMTSTNGGIPINHGRIYWRDWAVRVKQLYEFVPDPYQFNEWGEWAERVNELNNG